MLVCSMLRVDVWYCACDVDTPVQSSTPSQSMHTLYNHLPHPKACTHCTIIYPIPKHAHTVQSSTPSQSMHTLYNHLPHPKACTHCTIIYPIPKHARRAQSQVHRSRMLSNCASSAAQDVGTRNRTVTYMFDVHFAVRT